MKTIFRLGIFLRPFKWVILLSLAAGTATIISGIGLLGTSAYLLAMAALHPSIAVLQVAIVGVRFFGLSRGGFRYVERLSSHSVNLRVLGALRVWFYEKLERLAPARLVYEKSGDLLVSAMGDIETLENIYVRLFAPVVTAGLISLGMGLFLGSYDPTLGWILIFGMLISTVLLPFFHYFMTRNPGRRVNERRSEISSLSVRYIQGLGELMILDQSREAAREITDAGEQLGKAQIALGNLSGIANGLLVLVNGLTIWILLKVAIPMVNSGILNGVDLTVIILASIGSSEAAAPLMTASGLLESSLRAARKLFRLADEKPEVKDPISPQKPPEEMLLEMADIYFSYDENQEPALYHFDLRLEKGKRIAIVGESGAGKSTIANLLLRFWKVDSGEIRIGGLNVEQMKQECVREKFSLVGSEGWIFSGSIADNLRIAKQSASEEDLIEVIREVGLLDWVRSLPNGLETRLGERGITISGGQKQRIMVARAILNGAPIMIFDEPTNGLDAFSEQGILNLLFDTTKDRSSLWIMHRLIGLEKMDEIIVLKGGRIVERGSFDGLVKAKGIFARMLEVQSGVFIDQ